MRPSDLFLSPDLTEDDARAYLSALGFRDAVRVDDRLQGIAADTAVREALGRLAGDLLPALTECPDPDAAVEGLCRYLEARAGRVMLLEYLGEDPRALHVLVTVFGASPFLAGILIRNPEFFHWLVPQVERSAPEREDLEDEIATILDKAPEPAEALEALKRWNRREMLRIATRDLLRRETVSTVAAQLSDLAAATVDCALTLATQQLLDEESRDGLPGAFAVVAMDRLGGNELGYASRIDLLYVFDAAESGDIAAAETFQRLGRKLTVTLTDHTAEGYLYDVEPGLKPFAGANNGRMARSLDEYEAYYTSMRGVDDRRALIKARPIAGDSELSRRFMAGVQKFVYRDDEDFAALDELTRRAASSPAPDAVPQVELFTQVRQLAHGGRDPLLRQANTLATLDRLATAGFVSEQIRRELAHAYEFCRAVEHRLQLVREEQPPGPPSLSADDAITVQRLGLGSPEGVRKQLDACRSRVSELCRASLEGSGEAAPKRRGERR